MLREGLSLLGFASSGLPDPLPAQPFQLLETWLDEAVRAAQAPNPNAITLATATPEGEPSARVVLCKAIEPATGSIVFFTNYSSRKGEQLAANPRAAAVFHWDHAGRQARLEGSVERIAEAESDAYFRTRPLLSRLGAWASSQSRELSGREELLDRVVEAMDRFGVTALHLARAGLAHGADGPEIPRPADWGGFRLTALRVELWQGATGRLHDRAEWRRARPGESWRARRLFP